MAEMLTAVAIIFIIAGPFLLIANRYAVPPASLLIFAGLIAGLFIERGMALELAQFGIAILVFAFAVSIRLDSIRPVLADTELTAFAQISIVGGLGTAFGVGLGLGFTESLYLGIAAALSSTMVGEALLQTEIRSNLVRGRLSQSIQFIQDIFAVGFILIIGAGIWELDPIALNVGYGVMLLVAAVLINRYFFDVVRNLAGGSDELMIIGVITILAMFMGASVAVDVPMVIGAFAAGIAVKYDPGQFLGLLNGIDSIEDFFVAIFFVTVGALIVIPFVQMGTASSIETLVLVTGLVVLVLVVKPIVTVAILLWRGYEARTATITGLSTDQVSEFALIIAIQGILLEQLTTNVFDAIILAAAITMMVSPYTQRYSEHVYAELHDRSERFANHGKIDRMSEVPEELTDHIIIVGYGRKGSRLVELMEDLSHPYVVIENDPALHNPVRVECDAYVFGDAMEDYVWKKARAEDARAIISVTGSHVVSQRILDHRFDVPVILRARNEDQAVKLLDAGATYVAVPDLLAGEELLRQLKAVFEGDVTIDELRNVGIEALEKDRAHSRFHKDRIETM